MTTNLDAETSDFLDLNKKKKKRKKMKKEDVNEDASDGEWR